MTASRDEAALSRIELVVLACLSQKTPPTDAELASAVHQLAMPGETIEQARKRAVELLSELQRRRLVGLSPDRPSSSRKATKPVDSKDAERKLTDEGKRALRTTFKLTQTPTWAQVRDKHLPVLALGIAPGSKPAADACTESALIAAVLRTRFGVRDGRTPNEVCDALIANALGMPTGKLTLGRMRAHVLLQGLDGHAKGAPSPADKDYAKRVALWVACEAIGATGGSPKIATALGSRWVCGDANPPGVRPIVPTRREAVPLVVVPAPRADAAPPQVDGRGHTVDRAPTPEARPPQPPAIALLDVVRETIPRVGNDGRFGKEKVYVSAIWHSIDRSRRPAEMSLDHFKRWLVGANREGSLVLARADLIGAMDAKQVSESEINDRGATFHFVLDQRHGASASQWESHVR